MKIRMEIVGLGLIILLLLVDVAKPTKVPKGTLEEAYKENIELRKQITMQEQKIKQLKEDYNYAAMEVNSLDSLLGELSKKARVCND